MNQKVPFRVLIFLTIVALWVPVLALGSPVAANIPAPSSALISEDFVPQTEEEAAAELEKMTDSFTWESPAIGVALQEINAKFPDVASYLSVDAERRVLLVNYFDKAPLARRDEYLAAIGVVSASSAYPIEVSENSYNLADQTALALAIGDNPAEWGERLGGSVFTVMPLRDGSVEVALLGAEVEMRNLTINGVNVRAVGVDPPAGQWGPQGRQNDTSPWTGGSVIQNATSYCTQGFRWQRWATAEIVGGAAKHCGGSVVSSYLGTPIGPVAATSSAARDQNLIRSSTGSWSNSVWVSPTLAYPVINAAVLLPGATVAESLGYSGVVVTSVDMINASATYGGITYTPLTTSWSASCQGGDSGGPWLTTNGGAQVIAHGQHWGNHPFYLSTTGNATAYCAFYDVNTISSAVSATLKF